MIWPITADVPGLWLALYLATFALHVVAISYVVGGTGYALVQALRGKDDPIATRARDLLPFMLGVGITAGVAPLLFLQLLHQRSFYTANLVLGPRWGAVVPALIVGFYALYLAKATTVTRWRRIALGVALACFAFVAWSWTELHLLMQDEPAWRAMYAAGERVYGHMGVVPRLVVWLGAMVTTFAAVAAWWAPVPDRRRLAVLALAGRAVSAVAAVGLVVGDAAVHGAAHGWSYLLVVALVVEAGSWVWLWRAPQGAALASVTGAGVAALICGVVVREAPRLAIVEPPRPETVAAGGLAVFVATLGLGVVVVAWIVRAARRARPS